MKTPQEFYALTTAKRCHTLALAYMSQCSAEGFSRKSLFALKAYFAKVNPSELLVLYEYIYAMPEKTVVSLYDLYGKAQEYQGQQRMNNGRTEEKIEDYPSLLSYIKEE